ncbi:MAG: FIG00459611: hypothetical protein [uncultured Paraburkholderia sp.]|nr:MAG: FIG00459611: hypothetical protein [uncultured Paraburkholderia sp.]
MQAGNREKEKMKFRHIATGVLLGTLFCTSVFADENGCATFARAGTASIPQPFQVRDGEAVDLISGAKTVHGKLLVFGENGVFHAYWQAENSAEKYVLANAGENAVRLVSTPPQGSPAKHGEPGTTLGPLRVLSCPTL